MSSVTADSSDRRSLSESVRVGHGGDDPPPSRAVVEAVADAASVDPIDLADEAGIVLNDYVDLDALDGLVSGATEVKVSLFVADYAVSVDATAVVVKPVN